MSTLHLATGSEKPAPIDGLARLYSMKYCPFAHRARLVLSLKKIPHDIVNINLRNKPEWYSQVNPEGKVPSFVDGNGKVVVDSLVITNYLDEHYPEPPLFHKATKDRDLELIDKYSKITDTFNGCIHNKDKRPLDEIVAEIAGYLVEYEEELVKRGTTFFGGDHPGMVDVVMWPWVERAKALPLICKQPLNFDKEKFPHISKWIAEMKKQAFVQENAEPYEKFASLIEAIHTGNVDFDKI